MSPANNPTLIRALIRQMLLPIPPSSDAEFIACNVFIDEMSALGVESGDYHAWLEVETEKWKEMGDASDELRALIERILTAVDESVSDMIPVAPSYFSAYARLRSRPYGLTHDQTIALLSHSSLISRLATIDQMSASQIAAMLSARHSVVGVTWKSVQAILERMRIKPELDRGKVQEVWSVDIAREPIDFADADVTTSVSIVREQADRLGFVGDIEGWLLTLYTPEGVKNGPLLQILHYQCIIAEFFDHPVTWLYEFAPRGGVAGWVFSEYPGSMGVSGNPVLNNAKATPRADLGWASSRDDASALEALALSQILLGMEEMGFPARRELAGWIRRWLLRVIRLTEAEIGEYPQVGTPSLDEIQSFLKNMASAPTGTAGVLEQRVTDVGARLRHPTDGWQGRGLGDSVNASNVSKRKLGDCDFQHLSERRVIAYEAHGGTLNDLYIAEHERTLRKVLTLRKQEWGDEAWNVEVCFVAYANNATLPKNTTIDEIPIRFSWISFGEFVADMLTAEDLQVEFARYVATPLDQPRTPLEIRHKYKALAGYGEVQAAGPGDS